MLKRIALLLAVALAVTSAGCSGGNKRGGVDEGPIKISWVPQNDGPVDRDSPIKKLLEEKYDVQLEFIYMDRNKAEDLLNIRIASGDVPDVISTIKDSQFRNFIDQKVVSEIPEKYLKTNFKTLYDAIEKDGKAGAWDYSKENDKIYGIPTFNLDGRYHMVNIWRDDWLKKVGINKIPETLEEAEVAFYKFVNEDPDGNGKKDTYALSNKGIEAVFCAYGAYPYGMFWTMRNNKIVLSAVVPEMKEALKKLAQYYKDGLIDPEFITGENKGQNQFYTVSFWNGIIGFSSPGPIYRFAPALAPDLNPSANHQNFKAIQGENATYDYGKPLVGPEGKFGANHWGEFSGSHMVIGSKVAPESRKMSKILEINQSIMTNYEDFIFAYWGREGIDYKYENEIYVPTIDTKTRISYGLAMHGIGRLLNYDFAKKNEPKAKFELSEKHANYTDDYQNLIWGGLPSDLQYKSIISSKIDEAYIAFITGKRPAEEFDRFVQELYNSGLDKLTDEANEWYEKYGKKQ